MYRRVGTDNKITSIIIVCLLVIGALVGFVNFESENAQGTDVSGTISIDTTWDLAGSPYIVVDHVTVASSATLTIEPLVEVKFDGLYSLIIDGNLTAIGTETMRIIITSNKAAPALRDWQSIQVNSNGYAEIKYCDVSYSAFGIYLFPSSSGNIITNNTISYSGSGIFVRESSNNNIITYNNILNNEYGIHVRESSHNTITHNNIVNNDMGIMLWHSSNTIITNNNFVNDGIYILGDQLPHFNSHTIPDNNIVNSKPLYYYKDRNSINIDGIPVGQLILVNCTDFDVKNLQIKNTDIGIEVAYSTNISITNNNLSSNYGGNMYIYSSSNNKIIGNNITNSGWGIELTQSSNSNIIANNNISSNSIIGIGIGSSNNNIITNNNILSNNDYGVCIGVKWEDNSTNNIVTGNNISNNGLGIYIRWVTDNKIIGNNISNNEYGLYFNEPSNGNVITGNTISNNGNGSYLESSHYNIITNNIISSNNYDGIHLDKSSMYNNITGNHISFNLKGINISSSSRRNTIRNNNVSNNDYGIYITSSAYNEIYHNNFIDNANQAYDNTNNWNQWDNQYLEKFFTHQACTLAHMVPPSIRVIPNLMMR